MSTSGNEWPQVIDVAVRWATFGVLILAWWAAKEQAQAAKKLTTATNQQIKTSEEQARAAQQQVDLVRRQITEALRPILTFRRTREYGVATVKNEGSGVALASWVGYGTLSAESQLEQRSWLGQGLCPPGSEFTVKYGPAMALGSGGLIIVYESLAGRAYATSVTFEDDKPQLDYHDDVTEWAHKQNAPILPNAFKHL